MWPNEIDMPITCQFLFCFIAKQESKSRRKCLVVERFLWDVGLKDGVYGGATAKVRLWQMRRSCRAAKALPLHYSAPLFRHDCGACSERDSKWVRCAGGEWPWEFWPASLPASADACLYVRLERKRRRLAETEPPPPSSKTLPLTIQHVVSLKYLNLFWLMVGPARFSTPSFTKYLVFLISKYLWACRVAKNNSLF